MRVVLWHMKSRLQCFFLGHIEKMGERVNFEPDWCARCYCEWPQEKTSAPSVLHTWYIWFIDHSRLFRRLDARLSNRIRLPLWWEY